MTGQRCIFPKLDGDSASSLSSFPNLLGGTACQSSITGLCCALSIVSLGLESRVRGFWCTEHGLKPGADDGKLGTKKRGSLFIFPRHWKLLCFFVRAANKLDPTSRLSRFKVAGLLLSGVCIRELRLNKRSSTLGSKQLTNHPQQKGNKIKKRAESAGKKENMLKSLSPKR